MRDSGLETKADVVVNVSVAVIEHQDEEGNLERELLVGLMILEVRVHNGSKSS